MPRKMPNGIDLQGQRGQNAADGTAAADLVTKAQLDAIARGLDWKNSVRAATTAAVTQSGPQTVDGVALVAGDRVLDKDNATAASRGIWVVQAGAWTRATDFDDSVEVTAAAAVPVESGTTNGDAVFILTTDGAITVGTTALAFTRLGGSGVTYTAGNGLSLTGSVFAVVAGAGIIADGTSTRIDPAYSGLAKRYAQDVATTSTSTVTHNLGTQDHCVEVYLKANGEVVEPDVLLGVDADTLTFAVAPTTGQYRFVAVG